MTIAKVRTSTKTKPSAAARSRVAPKSKSAGKLSSHTATTAQSAEGQYDRRSSKHDRMLALLTRSEGVTIPELMNLTGWQQHSVRGFLAATVKKKLGLKLISSKPEGQLRRYRIQAKRGR